MRAEGARVPGGIAYAHTACPASRKDSHAFRLVWTCDSETVRALWKTAHAPGSLSARPGRIPACPVWSTHMLRKTAHAPRKEAPLPGGTAYAHTACPARPGSLLMRPGSLPMPLVAYQHASEKSSCVPVAYQHALEGFLRVPTGLGV